jgi:hypothetical protein
MATFLQLLVAGTIAQFAALYLFVQVAKTGWASAGKPVIIAAFAVAMATIVWKAVRSFKVSTLALLCVGLTVAGVAALQMLGFLVYPGLVKDVDFASSENAKLVLVQVATIFVVFLAMTTLLLLFNKAFNHYKKKAIGSK